MVRAAVQYRTVHARVHFPVLCVKIKMPQGLIYCGCGGGGMFAPVGDSGAMDAGWHCPWNVPPCDPWMY